MDVKPLEERIEILPDGKVGNVKLTDEESAVLWLRLGLYDGSWDKFKLDLQSKVGKANYVRHFDTILNDLGVIQQLESYEDRHKINLLTCKPVLEAIEI